MKYLLILSLLISQLVHSQHTVNCTRQIVDISCGVPSGIPIVDTAFDLYNSTLTYKIVKQPVFNNQNCFRFDSTTIGTTIDFVNDDVLSYTIPIGFNLPFFGNNYSNNWISTNGYQTFDNTWTMTFAQWMTSGGWPSEFEIMLDVANSAPVAFTGTGIIPHNLPSGVYFNTHYNRLTFQSCYHDMNPALTSSLTRRINFFNTGTGANRKFVTTWWRQPLYQCFDSIRNSHQSELWSNGILATKIYERQPCPDWNDGGRAMIGVQNDARTVAFMPPLRRASDPLWYGKNMNETWYFVPSSGTRLFQSATLLPNNLAGIVTYLNDGRIAIRYDLAGEPFGIKTYISQKLYSDGTVINDTIVINKILNPDIGMCTALSLGDDNRIVITPTYYEFNSITRGIHKVEIFNSKGQVLYRKDKHFNIGGNTVNFNVRSTGVLIMRITDPMTRKTFTKKYIQ